MNMNYAERIRSVYGSFAFYIASRPWTFCIVGFLLNGLLGFGMLNLPSKKLLNNNIADVYMPKNTPTQKTAENILKIFPDHSKDGFYWHQTVKQPLYAELIVWRQSKQSIINESLYDELMSMEQDIKNISITTVNGNVANYLDVCARRNNKCVINGENIIEQLSESKDGTLPLRTLISENTTILENPLFQLGDYEVLNDTIITAVYLKLRFNLCQDTSVNAEDSMRWMNHFVSHMKEFAEQSRSSKLHMAFSHSQSFLEELDNDTYGDIPYFSFVFTIYFVYIGFVMSGGNILAKRVHIGRMGIIVTPTSVLGAWGLLMACKVEFTNVLGITPVIIVSHQIINTMITLSHLSNENDETDGTKRVANAVRMSSLPVTVTMFCHVMPFAIAILSKYYAVKLVGLYMVTTLLFNYINHFVFYTACLAIHEHRIDAGRHCCICTKLGQRDDFEGRNCCIICCCSGTRPEKRSDTESSIEKITRNAMLRFLLTTLVKCISTFSYLVLVAFTIFGLHNYKIDIFQKSDIIPDSYFYKWNEVVRTYFKQEPIIQFVTLHPYGYMNDFAEILELRHKLESQSNSQSQPLLSWKDIYDKSNYTNCTSESATYEIIRNHFIPNNEAFVNDIQFDHTGSVITASRFYIKSKYVSSTKSLVSLKNDLLQLTDEINNLFKDKYKNVNQSLLPVKEDNKFVFVHSPDFLPTDYYHQPLWEILIFTGTQLLLLLFLLLLLKPCLSFLILIPLTYISMISCVFGISYFFGIYLTQVSLIMYMVAGSLCVENIVHIYYSFAQEVGQLKAAVRMNLVLKNTSQAVFHAIFGLFLGILVLFVVKSYVFVTVFRLTLLTTVVCILFTLLWIPTLLSWFGPVGSELHAETIVTYKVEVSSLTIDKNKSYAIEGTENPAFEH